jgi:hypothetical protein
MKKVVVRQKHSMNPCMNNGKTPGSARLPPIPHPTSDQYQILVPPSSCSLAAVGGHAGCGTQPPHPQHPAGVGGQRGGDSGVQRPSAAAAHRNNLQAARSGADGNDSRRLLRPWAI